MVSPIRIGTRASPLAHIQARPVQAAVAKVLGGAPPDADRLAPLTLITTTGDRIQDRGLLEIGGKAPFTREIDAANQSGKVDCACLP